MFGYVTAYKPELKMKDFSKYKAFYCGLCKTLQRNYGFKGQMTLSYDMTFLIVLMTSLYECPTTKEENRCVVHPIGKKEMFVNEITEYVADLNIVLSYYHFVDDWMDEKSQAGLAGLRAFRNAYVRIESKYPHKCAVIKKSLRKLHNLEKNNETNIDKVAGCFGDLMGELLVYKKDLWEEDLRRTGFYLGKFVYIMDAYDDIEKDIKSGSYNPLKNIYMSNEKKSITSEYEVSCNTMLTMMMAECTESFERLPCVESIDILRNILYVGVWNKFDKKRKEKYPDEMQSNQTQMQSNQDQIQVNQDEMQSNQDQIHVSKDEIQSKKGSTAE